MSFATPRFVKAIIAVVVVAWVASLLADALIPTYDPPQMIGLAFMAVLSAVLGSLAIKSKETKPEERQTERDNDNG